MIKITHKSVNIFYKIIKSPITAIFISLIISYFFYVLSSKNKEPLYNISDSQLVAQNLNESNISIKWKDSLIKNIYSINIKIWNNGDDIIDYSDFVANKPLTLYNEGKVKILKISSIKSSRPNIKFKPKILNDSIIFSLSNKEALEKGDGEMFSVLYSNINEEKWILKSRIKGAKYGFGFQEVSSLNSNKGKVTTYITVVLVLIIILRIFISIYKHKSVNFNNWELVFVLTYFIIIYLIPFIQSDGELLLWMK
ncbi:hypothetical protein M4I21_18050 [Cellulophaga sp. 20_2_10]|uniref:hypothetical protein n=1 Tax=Cellulophaga sp. 20_2_10 TaxID=2942476 RepID=UPI00201A5CE7|nr:hypothetical protein [Cellulophaga sp. 20_2_10]MCL5247721.1 hypothetical protein [Cellulophaga sp. 20_2_10]